MRRFASIAVALLTFSAADAQQDSVSVTFFYKPAGSPSVVYLPGEFNNWGPNSNGIISPGAPSQMTFDAASGTWSKTVKLRVGGPSPLPAPFSIPGAYQYKFNENGNTWLQDPLNPRKNPLDNNNSYLFIKSPTIHHLLPNELSPLQRTDRPEISAFIFPSVQSEVDTSTITLTVGGVVYDRLGSFYEPVTKKLTFVPPVPLENGANALKLAVANAGGSLTVDSTSFQIQGGFVLLFTLSDTNALRPTKLLEGSVEDTTISQVTIVQNSDSTEVSTSAGLFSYLATLTEGENVFRAKVVDSLGLAHLSSPITITYVVGHSPRPAILVDTSGAGVTLAAQPNDPDSDAVSYSWSSDDSVNPEVLNFSSTSSEVTLPRPSTFGEYYFDLTVADAAAQTGSARGYFIIEPDGSVTVPTVASNPHWVEDGVVYEIYVPAFSSAGTLSGISQRLDFLKDLGVSIIWLMPIYENGETINELNAGYNVTDFYKIHPQLGTLQDFDQLVDSAHMLGIKVILDSTPNHVSGVHEWVNDIRLFQDYSNYRPFVETSLIGGDRGLGQSLTAEYGYPLYTHYSNWSLANLDYTNVETSAYMLEMYRWWLLARDVDGYRMDVYWGPEERYGKDSWWRPFREEVKRIKPDVFVLGETDGTGPGSENNYADGGGASDAAYDWNLYGEVKNTLAGGSLANLDNRVRNYSPTSFYNFYTGPNARYFRFLENHDESRVASLYSTAQTRAAATLLLTIPGIPMVYAGQEVGETSRRGLISWNRQGGNDLFLFYQRLIAARNRFETFRSPEIVRLTSNHSRVYSYLRPSVDQNSVVAVNFSSSAATASLVIPESSLKLSAPLDSTRTYYMNDVQNDTAYAVGKGDLAGFSLTLQPWGSAVFILSDTLVSLTITSVAEVSETPEVPGEFRLLQNYPNPFNPGTTISYELSSASHVRLVVYDLLGQEVTTLLDENQPPGRYRVYWDGRDRRGMPVSSGMYLYRLVAGANVLAKKMVLAK